MTLDSYLRVSPRAGSENGAKNTSRLGNIKFHQPFFYQSRGRMCGLQRGWGARPDFGGKFRLRNFFFSLEPTGHVTSCWRSDLEVILFHGQVGLPCLFLNWAKMLQFRGAYGRAVPLRHVYGRASVRTIHRNERIVENQACQKHTEARVPQTACRRANSTWITVHQPMH